MRIRVLSSFLLRGGTPAAEGECYTLPPHLAVEAISQGFAEAAPAAPAEDPEPAPDAPAAPAASPDPKPKRTPKGGNA